MIHKILSLSFCVGIFFQSLAQTHSGPPEPPVGKRWVINPDFSDEFNGAELDASKWLDYHPKWKGREPGIFLPSQVSVKDGYLQIKGEKLKRDTIIKSNGKEYIFNIAGGAVVSKKEVFLGYYECRLKAAATTMSSTFWFSSKESYEGPNGCDRYNLEWDIQECIGRTGDFNGKFFSNGMNSNGHFWYSDCDNERHNLIASSVKFTNDELASENFHVYGGWWRDESSASFYYDNSRPKHIKFYDKVKKKPFDQPMVMRLVSETYPFPWIELPTDEELADPTKNTVYYDWVRGYKLVDVADEHINQDYEIGLKLYDEVVNFPVHETQLELLKTNAIKLPLSFKANEKRTIHIIISETMDRTKVKADKKVATMTFDVYPGYGNMEVVFQLDSKLSKTTSYKVEAIIRDINGTNVIKDALDTSTMFFELK